MSDQRAAVVPSAALNLSMNKWRTFNPLRVSRTNRGSVLVLMLLWFSGLLDRARAVRTTAALILRDGDKELQTTWRTDTTLSGDD